MSRYKHTARGDVLHYMGDRREKIIVAPHGILRSDTDFDSQVAEYNMRRSQLLEHRKLIDRLTAEADAASYIDRRVGHGDPRTPQRGSGHVREASPCEADFSLINDSSPQQQSHQQQPQQGDASALSGTQLLLQVLLTNMYARGFIE